MSYIKIWNARKSWGQSYLWIIYYWWLKIMVPIIELQFVARFFIFMEVIVLSTLTIVEILISCGRSQDLDFHFWWHCTTLFIFLKGRIPVWLVTCETVLVNNIHSKSHSLGQAFLLTLIYGAFRLIHYTNKQAETLKSSFILCHNFLELQWNCSTLHQTSIKGSSQTMLWMQWHLHWPSSLGLSVNGRE